MINRIKQIITVSLLLMTHIIYAQVVAEGDTILCDGQQGTVGVTLTATSYAVDLTDSNIYTDDIFGGVINMNFDFEFYGNTYNQVVLSSNNYLSFNTANAGAYSGWAIGAAVPNNFDAPMNAILCPWQDIYPGVNGNGTIQYATIGEAPNRVFIASFCGIPMFSCTDICYSSQIKLFETTNVIETHIAQKVLCDTWNDGAAIHALHNENGTIAHVVTDLNGIERNYPNDWTCENDGWRFTPNGSADYVIENIEFAPAVAGTDIIWQDEFGNQIGTGGEIVVFPSGDVTFTAGASLCGSAGDWCGFQGGIEGDDVTITFEELSIDGNETDITCYEAQNGTIEIIAPNSGDWLYELENENGIVDSQASSGSSFIFQNLAPGTYSATITETNTGCVTEALSFTLIQPEQVTSITNIIDVSCNSGSDGSITIELSGGTSPYNTVFGDMTGGIISEQSGSNIVFDNLEAGAYFFSTYDTYGCLLAGDEIEFIIEQPDEIIILESYSDYTDYGISCNGENDGWIDIDAIGGTGSYSYEWSNGETTQNISNLTAGNYSLVLTDGNGCTNSISVFLTEPDAITGLEMNTDQIGDNVYCNPNENGLIDVMIEGGTGIYSYSWSNGATTEDLSGLPPGNYTLVATDENECSTSLEVILMEISETHNLVSCYGGNDGEIDINVEGGNNYTYVWSNGETTEDLEGLIAGFYSVEATDEDGCSIEIDVEITQPDEMTISETHSDYTGYGVTCYGENDGWIDVNITGGIGPYSFLWTNGAVTEDLSGLSPGNYALTAIDQNGCSIEIDVEITEPDTMNISETHSTYNSYGVSCYQGNDGWIDINITGGTETYTYAWSNGETTEDIENIEEGMYFVVASDGNGCSITIDIEITEPQEIIINSNISDYSGSGVSCNGGSNGWINTQVTGGTELYTYLWSNGSTSNNTDNLSEGTHTVTVTDSNGCEVTESYVIQEPDEIIIDGVADECIGDVGEINITVDGGVSTYTYSWTATNGIIPDGQENNQDLFGLTPGTYGVLVTDQNNCEQDMEFILNAAPIADFSTDEYEFDLSETPIEFVDESEDENISLWNWDFGDGNSSDEINPMHLYTEPGVYYVNLTITDDFGCEDEITKKIECRHDYYAYTPNIFTPNDDGINDTFKPSLLNVKIETYELVIYDRWGNQIFKTTEYSTGWDGKLQDGTFLPPDVYNYKLIYKTKLGDEKIETGRFTMAR